MLGKGRICEGFWTADVMHVGAAAAALSCHVEGSSSLATGGTWCAMGASSGCEVAAAEARDTCD